MEYPGRWPAVGTEMARLCKYEITNTNGLEMGSISLQFKL